MGALSTVVGFLYPLYQSLKVIENPTLPLLNQWLTYWIVYGVFTMVESFSDTALSWIPLYYPFKLGFLLWCFLPQYLGALTVYKRFLYPLFTWLKQEIEEPEKVGEEDTVSTAATAPPQIEGDQGHIQRLNRRHSHQLAEPGSQ